MRTIWIALAVVTVLGCADEESVERYELPLRIATYNTFLRPGEGVLVPDSDASCRAREIGRLLASDGEALDLVALQETFDGALTGVLSREAGFAQAILGRPEPCEQTEDDCKLASGGNSVVGADGTRFVEHQVIAFRECAGSDCTANKGAVYVDVEVSNPRGPSAHLNVLATHLDATSASAREAQFEQIRSLLERVVCQNEERRTWPTVMLGDFNVVDVGSQDDAEYDRMLENLTVSCMDPPLDAYRAVYSSWSAGDAAAGTMNCIGSRIDDCMTIPLASLRLDYAFLLEPKGEHATVKITGASTDAYRTDACRYDVLSDHKRVRVDWTLGYTD